MHVEDLGLAGVKLLRPRRYTDHRGYFVETWNRKTMAAIGIEVDFVQDNLSYSRDRGTIRGLHFQRAPSEQAKLVRAVRGSILDVAVDIRPGSPTYRRSVSAVLTAEQGEQLYVPAGCAHGFCTLEPDTEVAYKVSSFYAPEQDAGIAWDDPDLGIDWRLGGAAPVLSDKDARLPRLSELGSAP
jgi:dTDP-4-dehydrorhamnose 3,5-epimerase